jgi:hypothetical protein
VAAWFKRRRTEQETVGRGWGRRATEQGTRCYKSLSLQVEAPHLDDVEVVPPALEVREGPLQRGNGVLVGLDLGAVVTVVSRRLLLAALHGAGEVVVYLLKLADARRGEVLGVGASEVGREVVIWD